MVARAHFEVRQFAAQVQVRRQAVEHAQAQGGTRKIVAEVVAQVAVVERRSPAERQVQRAAEVGAAIAAVVAHAVMKLGLRRVGREQTAHQGCQNQGSKTHHIRIS
ncbi:MAG: hypothetical protein NVS3B25_19410 [Hymenobacter sp.]